MKHTDIDALARLLDGDLPEGEVSAEARALGMFAKALEGSVAPAPAFAGKADLRAALIASAREQAARPSLLARMRGSVNEATNRWRYSMRVAAATGASAMALSSGGVALASQQALPGDALYGVKLVLEDVGLLFIGDQAERGEQQLVDAGERIDEAAASAETGDMGGAMRALRESDESARSGAGDIIEASQERGDPSLLGVLETFSRQQRSRLAALLPLLSGEAAAAGNDAMVGLNRIDQRVAVLGGGGGGAACGECDTETAQAGGGKGRKGQAQSTSTGQSAPADARDFDFADIPPASEPFAPCPCTTTTSEPTAADDPTEAADEPGDKAEAPKTEKPRKPREPKPTEEPKPPADDEEEVRPTLPPELEEPVDDVEEPVEEVIDGVIDELPTEPPVPPSSSGGVRAPVPAPTVGVPAP